MAWALDLEEQFRIAARNLNKVLKGTKPGGIPIQYPARYYLTINARTGQNLGLTLPAALIAQADRILSERLGPGWVQSRHLGMAAPMFG